MTTAKKHTGIEDLFFAFQKKIFDAIKQEVKELNCSVTQIELLRYLKEHGEISLTDTAKLLSISKPSASVMIDGMERRGYIYRTFPKDDRRSIALKLTPKSSAICKKIEGKKKKVIAVLLKKMSGKEQTELTGLLRKLIEE